MSELNILILESCLVLGSGSVGYCERLRAKEGTCRHRELQVRTNWIGGKGGATV